MVIRRKATLNYSHEIMVNKKTNKKNNFFKYVKRNYGLYMLLIPGFIFLLIFHYVPLYGIVLAFKDFNMFSGNSPFMSIVSSPWVGLKVFKEVFSRPDFYMVFSNTLIISIYKLIFLFPLPIILAILLNEVNNRVYKKNVQTVIYLPHFLSWTIVSGIFFNLLGTTGIANQFLKAVGIPEISFLMDPNIFRSVIIFTAGWKNMGWSSIVYLAAITSIDQEQYEAAKIDGANKFQQIKNITLPGMVPIIIMLLILQLGSLMDAGFEQIFVMYNPTVYDVSDIIGTYVYRMGLGKMNFSLGTAIGLFNSVISFTLIYSANSLCKRFLGKSIW